MDQEGITKAATDVLRAVEHLLQGSMGSPSTQPWSAVSIDEVRLRGRASGAPTIEIVFRTNDRPGCRFGLACDALESASDGAAGGLSAEAWASEIVAELQETVEAEDSALPACEPDGRIHWIA